MPDLYQIDLKTAFLQGEVYAESRDVICQLPPEAGLPSYMAARLKRPAYGLSDAPRRWGNIVDKAFRSYGLVPVRDDRCCCALYSDSPGRTSVPSESRRKDVPSQYSVPLPTGSSRPQLDMTLIEVAMEYLVDPVTGSPSWNTHVIGILCLHVDDLVRGR